MRLLKNRFSSSAAFALMVCLGCCLQARAQFQNGMNASFVLGQSNFISSNTALTQLGVDNPYGVSVDSSGDVWVADTHNNRVLEFFPPFFNGMKASLVLGQSNFTSSNTAITQSRMSLPDQIAVDSSGNVWVSDTGNNRVLEFVPPFSNGMNASFVLGQSNFTSSNTATTQSGMSLPNQVAVDSSGNVWVSDTGNNRILEFVPAFSNGMNASLVLGQADYISSGVATTQTGMNSPHGISVDHSGNVWVSDTGNSRALEFIPAFSNGMNASLVLGQADYISSGIATTQLGMDNPYEVSVDSSGDVWVSDTGNTRVLEFVPVLSNGMNASLVLGQSNFTSSNTAVTQSGLDNPYGVFIDSSGDVWVSDFGNSRVLAFESPLLVALSGTALGVSSIAWTWSAVSGASSYAFYPSTGGPPINLLTTTFTQMGLSTNTVYGGQIAALSSAGESPISAVVSTYTLSAPPINPMVASIDLSSGVVSWTPVTSAGYAVQASSTNFGILSAGGMIYFSSTTNSGASSLAVTGLNANTTYYFQAGSYNGNGILNADLAGSSATLANQVSNSQVYRVLETSATLNWQALPSAPSSSTSEGYELDASTAADFTGTIFSSITTNVSLSTLSLTGLNYNTNYYFRVGSLNWSGVLNYIVAGSTLTNVGPPPASPQISAVYFSSIAVSWGSVNALDGYELDASTAPAFSGTLFSSITIDGTATSLALTGLSSNTTYYLRVGSFWNGAPDYAQPPPGSTSTLAAFPLALAPTNISSTSVTANWGAGSNPSTTLYIAQISTNGFVTLNASSATFNASAIFSGLIPATIYNFRVEAIGNNGQATPFTTLASTMTLLTSPGSVTPVFTQVAITSAAVQWTGGGNPVGMSFIAQISTDNFATLIFSSTTQNLSAIFGTGGAGSALVPDTDYNFRVEASSGANNSAFLVLGSTYTLAEPPTGTTIPIISSNSVALQWQANGNPTGANYQVWEDTTPAFLAPVIMAVSGNSLIAGNLVPSTSYYFKVEAVNGDNISTTFDVMVTALTSEPTYVTPSSLDIVRVYPNPYKPNGGNPNFGKPYNPGDPTSGVLFDQLPLQTTIHLYTLTGRLLASLGPPNSAGVIQWSAKNSIGQDVASGVYFAVLSCPTGKATKKIIVIR